MSVSRRRMLGLTVGVTLAGALAVLPVTALEAHSPGLPLPESIEMALATLIALGFEDIVSVYFDLRPTIEFQSLSVPWFVGLTDAWVAGQRKTVAIRLRADLEQSPGMLIAVLAHELMHVRQLVQQPEVYANCLEREVPAYQLQVAVLKAWCAANPLESHGLPVSNFSLIAMADHQKPESLESFANHSSCGAR